MQRVSCIIIVLVIMHESLALTDETSSSVNHYDRNNITAVKELFLHLDETFVNHSQQYVGQYLTNNTNDSIRTFDRIVEFYNQQGSNEVAMNLIIWCKNQVSVIDNLYDSVRDDLDDNSTVQLMKTIEKIESLDVQSILNSEIFDKIDGIFHNSSDVCNSTQSMQLQFFTMYNIIERMLLRYTILSTFDSILNTSMNFDDTLKNSINSFSATLSKYRQGGKEFLSKVSREICNGNPLHHEQNVTFIELERTFQYFVKSADDLQPNERESTCDSVDKRVEIEDCNGEISQCTTIGDAIFSHIQIVKARNSSRRYRWFGSIADDNVYGPITPEELANRPKTRHIPWVMIQPQPLEVCACLCFAKSADLGSIKTISLMSQVSDIQQNMVVTGVKFVLKNRMIHIQIKEGKLSSRGVILNGTEAWKPIENIELHQDGLFYRKIDDTHFRLTSLFDYVQIGKHHRIIGLSNVKVPINHVVTGVRLVYEKPTENYEDFWPISLEVRATAFDFQSGRLLLSENNNEVWIKSPWPNVDELESGNYETLFKNGIFTPDNPLQSLTNAVHHDERYAVFVESNLKSDAGQTTVPFFDAQPVELNEKVTVALDGVGLTRKGEKRGGGFLTLKISTIDYSQYI